MRMLKKNFKKVKLNIWCLPKCFFLFFFCKELIYYFNSCKDLVTVFSKI